MGGALKTIPGLIARFSRGPREVTDLWEQRSLGKHDKLLKVETIPSHGVVFVRFAK